MTKKIAVIVVTLSVLGGLVVLALTTGSDSGAPSASITPDYREDPNLARAIGTTLSLESVMTRLSSGDKSTGFPTVRYAVDTITSLGSAKVEVQYRIYIQKPYSTQQIKRSRVFLRNQDGGWVSAGSPK